MKLSRLAGSLGRWAKRLLLLVVVAAVLYESWIFAWVLWWRQANPETTRFMEIRLAELRVKEPRAQLRQHWTDYDAISRHLKRAVVSAEDDLFVQHHGFDWKGMQKALERNEQRGKIAAGGSTITQQLAKNLWLTPDKTLWRKAPEAIIPVMIEATWSKRRILEVYLNVIEWGNGIYGAEAASRRYFKTSAANLGRDQAARLAAMVPNPRWYENHRSSRAYQKRVAAIQRYMGYARVPR